MDPYLRNTWLAYGLSFANAFVLGWAVVQVLFFQSLGLSYFQIGVFFAVLGASFVVMEIPTGMFADIYGRKASIIVSSLCYFFGVTVFAFFPFYEAILFAGFLLASGTSFNSGSFDSILFESLRRLKRQKQYTKILSVNHFLFVGLGAITNFLIPIIFEHDTQLPFLIGLCFSVLAIIFSLLLYELKKKRLSFVESYKRQFIDTRQFLESHSRFRWLLLYAALLSVAIATFGDILNQPFIKAEVSFFTYGLVFALASIIQAFIILFFDKLIAFIGEKRMYVFLVFAFPLSLLLLLIPFSYLLPLSLAIIWSIGSLRRIFLSNRINTLMRRDSVRATAHSVNSMAESGVAIIAAPVLAYGFGFLTLTGNLLLLVVVGLCLPSISLFFKPKNI